MKAFLLLFGGVLAALPARAQDLGNILAPVNAPAVTARHAATPARTTGSIKLGEAEIFERVARKLTERLALKDGELSVSPISAWTPVDVPAGTWDITLLEAPDAKGLVTQFYVKFHLDVGDHQVGEWQVPIRAEYYREVWVANRRLARGETPAPADLDKRRLNVLAERQPPIPARESVDGYEVAQSIAAGQPLTERDLTPRTLVHRGQTVSVVAADGTFSISMKALATQDGSNGAIIKVRNTTSQRDITAQVVGENRVEVRF